MAPRKLIIAMLILLGFSTGLAVLAPDPPRPERQVVEEEPERDKPPPRNAGEAGTNTSPSLADPNVREVEVVAGEPATTLSAAPRDRLILTVRSDQTAVIEVGGLGLTGVANRYAPANFDLLLPERPGRYTVREQRGGPILEIAVRD